MHVSKQWNLFLVFLEYSLRFKLGEKMLSYNFVDIMIKSSHTASEVYQDMGNYLNNLNKSLIILEFGGHFSILLLVLFCQILPSFINPRAPLLNVCVDSKAYMSENVLFCLLFPIFYSFIPNYISIKSLHSMLLPQKEDYATDLYVFS